MAKQRPIGKCKLCGEEKQLCDSHYLPKRLYKMLNAPELGNPNPVMSINGELKQISAQYRGYVLCDTCEGLFSKLGEKWVLANIPTKVGAPFPLQDALAPLAPIAGGERWERYDVSDTKGFDLEKLIYFGMSIFWRGCAHDWKTNAGQLAPHVDLDAHAEPVRKFLLGDEPFPDNMVLAVDIWPYKPVKPLLIYPVITEELSPNGFRYWFYVPGLMFFLFVGSAIPQDAQESDAMHGVVTVDLDNADWFANFLKKVVKTQGQGAKIEAMLKEIAAIKASDK